jgi:hypothetical protein
MSVPIGQSERLRDTLISLGHVPVHVRTEGAGHGSLPADVQACAQLFVQDQRSPLLVDGFDLAILSDGIFTRRFPPSPSR